MDTIQKASNVSQDLSELRAESLKIVALFVGAIGYVWLCVVIWPVTGGERPVLAAFVGSALLTLGVSASFALCGRQLTVAAGLLLSSVLLAMTCAMLAYELPEMAYLFMLPVVFASVFLGQRALLSTASASVCSILTVNRVLAGHWVWSPGLLLPIAAIALVTPACWLSVNNLYNALRWAWQGYEQARRNEQLAQQHRGQLARALKALDEAMHRLERTNYMLAVARDQAEEARRHKQQFAQNISHELRTPLNLIVGFAELMTESPEYYGGELPPSCQRDLNIIYRNGCHLQGLVNDVLDLARIDVAHMGLMLEEVDPGVLTQDVVNTARGLIESHGLTLHTEVPSDLSRVKLDPTRIRQVIFNLLNNAARFTDKGSIMVRVCRHESGVLFAVADTGVGIAQEDTARIFDEFQQVDGSTRRRHEGVGLGLAISRRFVEMHGGRIWVESQLGRGSTFYFTVPVAGDALPDGTLAGQALRSSASALVSPGEMPALLVVTRSPSGAALLARSLVGCRTVIVSDLVQARDVASHLMPQAIVVDQVCTELTLGGLAAMGRDWDLPRVPIISCCLPGEEPLRQGLVVDGYLIKPVTRQSVWDALRLFGERVDRVLVIDDDRDFVLLMRRILEDHPLRQYRVIGAYAGREALDLVSHLPPDAILLDLELPDMDGRELIEQLRADPSSRGIPIVVVSGRDDTGSTDALVSGIVVAKGGGVTPGETLGWIRHIAGATAMVSPTPSALSEAPLL